MTTNRRVIEASPDEVWDVLADGWLYPLWVVGATRMRDVDVQWPAVGSALHHSVGVWPLTVDDDTKVLEVDPKRRLQLRAAAWPGGEAHVEITLVGQGPHTEVTIAEHVVKGPARVVPRPVEAALMRWRNTETLRRLAFVVEGRAA